MQSDWRERRIHGSGLVTDQGLIRYSKLAAHWKRMTMERMWVGSMEMLRGMGVECMEWVLELTDQLEADYNLQLPEGRHFRSFAETRDWSSCFCEHDRSKTRLPRRKLWQPRLLLRLL
jgi:hypothetical protein